MTDDHEDDDQHRNAHLNAENAVLDVLEAAFPDAPSCRTAVLLQLLSEDVDALTDVEEVRDVLRFLTELVVNRTMDDFALFNTQGSA